MIEFQDSVYQDVWLEGLELRRNGELLALAKHVRCRSWPLAATTTLIPLRA